MVPRRTPRLALLVSALAAAPVIAQSYHVEIVVDDQGEPVNGFAIGMNESGDIAGIESVVEPRAFVARGDGSFEWLTPPAGTSPAGLVWAIGDAGHIGGLVADGGTGRSFPVVFDPDGVPTVIPLPDGFLSGGITAINAHGVAVGWFAEFAGPSPSLACITSRAQIGFRWDPVEGLELLPAPGTTADCELLYIAHITDAGDIVGTAVREMATDLGNVQIPTAFVETADGVRTYYPAASLPGLPRASYGQHLTESGYISGFAEEDVFGLSPFVIEPDGTTRSPALEDNRLAGTGAFNLNEAGEGVFLSASVELLLWGVDTPTVNLTEAIGNGFDGVFVNQNGAITNIGAFVASGVDLVTPAGRVFRMSPATPDCPADINNDGILTGADFNAFLTAFSAMDPAADQNNDGSLTGADFNAFIGNFVDGCD